MNIDLASYIDHTLLSADATAKDIKKLCSEAIEYKFRAVCVNSARVDLAARALLGSNVQLASTIAFPLGAQNQSASLAELTQAVTEGATELDVVMPLGLFRDGEHERIVDELRALVDAAQNHVVKVIIECGLWTDAQIESAAGLVVSSGANFVKTSTGFIAGGAQENHVRLLRTTVGPDFGVKASGGIRTREQALTLIRAGANRIGTSAGVTLMTAPPS